MGAFSGYKYKMTDETNVVDGRLVHRIVATRDFDVRWPNIETPGFAKKPLKEVKTGDKGGWIEKEENLCQMGGAWVADEAVVYDHALVMGEALVSGNAIIGGWATIHEGAMVTGVIKISGKEDIGKHTLLGSRGTFVSMPKTPFPVVRTKDIKKVLTTQRELLIRASKMTTQLKYVIIDIIKMDVGHTMEINLTADTPSDKIRSTINRVIHNSGQYITQVSKDKSKMTITRMF